MMNVHVHCNNCGRAVEQRDTWRCLWCYRTICAYCYIFHSTEMHGDKYIKRDKLICVNWTVSDNYAKAAVAACKATPDAVESILREKHGGWSRLIAKMQKENQELTCVASCWMAIRDVIEEIKRIKAMNATTDNGKKT